MERNTDVAREHRNGPVKLRAPATFTLREGYFRFADAHIDAAGGTADIGEFVWNDGHITTRGAFTGIAVANAATLAGIELPIESTLVAGGEWSIAAAPRLNGTFAIRRERGDLDVNIGTDGATQLRGLGITALTVTGRFDNDALDATRGVRLRARGNGARNGRDRRQWRIERKDRPGCATAARAACRSRIPRRVPAVVRHQRGARRAGATRRRRNGHGRQAAVVGLGDWRSAAHRRAAVRDQRDATDDCART